MRPRQKPIPVPDSPIYFSVDTNHGGSFQFRVPRMSIANKVMRSIPDEYHQVMADDTASVYQFGAACNDYVAATIGVAWYHPEQELEARYQGDLDAYGQAVAEELHEAGIDLVTQVELFGDVLAKLTDILIPRFEVEEQIADFPDRSGENLTQA